MNKVLNPKPGPRATPPDRVIFWLAVALLGCGAVVVFSASAHIAGESYDAPLFFFLKQFLFFLLGLGVLLSISRVPYTFWQRTYRWWLVLGFVLLCVVLFMPAVRGARRWLLLGPLNLQVAEVFRFGMVIFMAATLARRPRCEVTFKQRVMPHLAVLAVGGVLLMLQPDFSSVVVLAATVVAILFFAGIPWRHLLVITVPAIGLCALVVFGMGYKRVRLANFLDGVIDPFAASYQVRQGAIYMGSGGLTGTGLGGGMAKFHYVPDAHTDFILASIGEELGFVATLAIVTAYALLLARGLRIAGRARDRFAALLAAGLTATLGIQMVVNLGVVLGLLPPTGLPLPLLSYGGSSALFTAGALAIILSVSRYVRE